MVGEQRLQWTRPFCLVLWYTDSLTHLTNLSETDPSTSKKKKNNILFPCSLAFNGGRISSLTVYFLHPLIYTWHSFTVSEYSSKKMVVMYHTKKKLLRKKHFVIIKNELWWLFLPIKNLLLEFAWTTWWEPTNSYLLPDFSLWLMAEHLWLTDL